VQPAHIIAVLPFKPLVAKDADASLEMGMTDTLIAKLSGIRDVIVRPLGAVRKYTQLDLEPLIAGRDLGVGAVLDGSLQKSGDDIRVTVRLISVTSGGSIWAGTFEEKFTSIFALQDSISEKVVAALALRLSSEEKKQLTKRDTESTEAYQLYLKGRYFWWKGQPQEFRKSRDYFHRAVEVDPSYALGYCGLNSFYGFGSAWGMLPPEENWPKALAANARALELDETLVQAHTNQGAAHLVYHRDFAAAEREITYAIGLNPRFEESHYLYSFFLIIVGRFDEAIDEARRALELDPFSIRILQHLGDTFYYARRYDEAVAQYRIALELEPSNPALHESLGSVFKRKGQTAEAVAEWQTATKLGGDNELSAIVAPRSNSNGGLDRALRSVTKKKLERLTARDESGDYIPAIEYARAYVQLGETEQALKWLVKAADERDVFALLLGVDPFYDSLREDGRFTTILKRIGAPFAR
jgi:TolB-like protein/Tfp pilus assembly protein PilF